MKRHRKSLRPVTDINLTSMLDVAFVLLIAFMIVAPSLKYGYKIDLPSDANPPSMDELKDDIENKPMVISVPRPETDGAQKFMLNENEVSLEQLEEQLAEIRSKRADLVVEVQADKSVAYEMVIRAVGAARRAGVESFGLPVDEQDLSAADVATKPKK